MKIGAVISVAVAIVAVAGLTMVFVGNSSPYVTIQDAQRNSQRVHVVGKISQETLKRNILAREVRFDLKDDTGVMPVRYVGPPQSNLESATQVVVIGSVDNGVFNADQMLVKCPSKYESDPNANKAASKAVAAKA